MRKKVAIAVGLAVAGGLTLFRGGVQAPRPEAPPPMHEPEPEVPPAPAEPPPAPTVSFPLHLKFVRTESDYEVQKRSARPVLGTDMATFQYDPMKAHVTAEEDLEVKDLRALVELLSDADTAACHAAREKAVELYPQFGKELGPLLRGAIGRRDLAWGAAQALASVDPKAALPLLLRGMKEADGKIRGASLEGLAYLEGEDAEAAVDGLLPLLEDPARRRDALEGIRSLSRSARKAVGPLVRLLEDRESRLAVLAVLEALGPDAKEALPAVERLTREGDILEKAAAERAAAAIRGGD